MEGFTVQDFFYGRIYCTGFFLRKNLSCWISLPLISAALDRFCEILPIIQDFLISKIAEVISRRVGYVLHSTSVSCSPEHRLSVHSCSR